mmetsp:Transcript_17927/g.38616  ORF Transcript_17927/g.38616 Transcript_17927/m.38616 type:complete len:88 (+) Transcript_17927:14-277(+)
MKGAAGAMAALKKRLCTQSDTTHFLDPDFPVGPGPASVDIDSREASSRESLEGGAVEVAALQSAGGGGGGGADCSSSRLQRCLGQLI